MSEQDPISDMVVRIKNSARMGHETVQMPCSVLKIAIVEVLKQEGYIQDFDVFENGETEKTLEIELKYQHGESVFENVKRVSKVSRRKYVSKDNIPSVVGGLGSTVLTTSKGVMTGREAREQGIGGEVLLKIW